MSAEVEAASSEKSLLVSFGQGVQFKNQQDLELNKIYQKIQKPSDKHIDQIQQLRKLAEERANESDEVKVKKLTKQIDGIKKGLPAFTASGTFPEGRRKAEALVKHSGRLQIDIDKLPATPTLKSLSSVLPEQVSKPLSAFQPVTTTNNTRTHSWQLNAI